jgi:hypothetical protein
VFSLVRMKLMFVPPGVGNILTDPQIMTSP